ncbi:hypothetical protein [Flavobacterium sp. MK4S-17]|jgi:hypothetical protein|uniref:hypothetical protein n=1 Tax=Flavobacterium sp. MK4S-17 TaxID=2543737 RepID=UPI0013572E7A|nr:hypothetical protein [Flavobacterium sp. MK4S-17]
MSFDYKKLEKELESACSILQKEFQTKFDSNRHISVRGAQLEAFIEELQKKFENTADAFLQHHALEKDIEARKKVLTIVKLYAKKCIEEYSKVE